MSTGVLGDSYEDDAVSAGATQPRTARDQSATVQTTASTEGRRWRRRRRLTDDSGRGSPVRSGIRRRPPEDGRFDDQRRRGGPTAADSAAVTAAAAAAATAPVAGQTVQGTSANQMRVRTFGRRHWSRELRDDDAGRNHVTE